MSKPLKLIGPVPATTPAPELTRGQRRALPDDVLREASRRLGILALLGAALWTVATAMGYLLEARSHPGGGFDVGLGDAIAGGSVIMSLALFLYSRDRDRHRDPRSVLDLGLAYLVVTAFAIGQTFHSNAMPATTSVSPMISWTGVFMLMFAAITPSTPGKMLVACLLAASMNPVGMLIARARGNWDFGPISNVLVMHYPDFVIVGVAVVISHVVARLGQKVLRARELGSYRLGALLGRGGMGEVYRATHSMLARPAAIKLIRPEMLGGRSDDAKIVTARFRREAEAAATLRSPHTVELYDFGEAGDRTLYLVMELLDGMDLETLIRSKGPVPAGRAVYILRQVCESLEEAHARGLVHRDIKPANIHVGRLGLRHDFVKVLDFGLVKSMAAVDSLSLETAAGMTPGTPAYLAPEVGVGDTIDARTDLYALGCVAYFLLTGTLVFEARTAAEMVAKHLLEEPVPPSRRTELAVPVELDRLVLACLAKKPADRPPSAAALSRSLAAIESEPWGEEQAQRWWQLSSPG